MKTTSMLFGLLTVACASSQPEPVYPLCDREGAPACGNIGQVGGVGQVNRGDQLTRPEVRNQTQQPAPARETAALRATPIVNVLLGASSQQTSSVRVMSPLIDDRREVACGNVMTKGGSRRVCAPRGDDALEGATGVVAADGER